MDRKYDVIVIGAGNGGLTAAVRMALAGKKTLLVEKHNLPGGFATSFVRGRFEFEASLHELCGIGPITGVGALKDTFKELGIYDKVEWVSLDEAFRVITTGDENNIDYAMPLGRDNFIAKAWFMSSIPSRCTIVARRDGRNLSVKKELMEMMDCREIRVQMKNAASFLMELVF